MNDFPKLYIVGAMKAATTSLANALDHHGVARFSSIKEPNYFICSRETFAFAGPGPSPDKFVDFSMTEVEYLDLYKNLAGAVTGDASTNYLPSLQSPGLIRGKRPDAKIIVILRHPITRAHSAFNFMAGGAGDPQHTFEAAIASEMSGERDDWLPSWRYLHYGLYDIHVARWAAEFGVDNVLVMDFGTLLQNPTAAFAEIVDFLDLDMPEEPILIPRDNATTLPASFINAELRRTILSDTRLKEFMKRILPARFRQNIKKQVLTTLRGAGKRPEKITDSTYAELEKFYRASMDNLHSQVADLWPDNTKLAESIKNWTKA